MIPLFVEKNIFTKFALLADPLHCINWVVDVDKISPPFGDNNRNLGPLHILEDSFKFTIHTTHSKVEVHNLKENIPLRADYNTKLLERKKQFREKIITCKWGEIIFFNKALMHKSGINKTKNKMRYILGCFYHDILSPYWRFASLDHKSQGF